MKYLYIIYKGHVPEILCEEYTGRWDKNKPHQDNKIRHLFYKNSPPPILIVAVIKIVRVGREAVLLYEDPPGLLARKVEKL